MAGRLLRDICTDTCAHIITRYAGLIVDFPEHLVNARKALNPTRGPCPLSSSLGSSDTNWLHEKYIASNQVIRLFPLGTLGYSSSNSLSFATHNEQIKPGKWPLFITTLISDVISDGKLCFSTFEIDLGCELCKLLEL